MTATIVTWGHGFSAAARERAATNGVTEAMPIVLAGRWKGPRHSYNLRGPDTQKCGGKPCELTYDIVACAEGWCGIAVGEDTPCGAIALRLKANTAANRRNAFSGKLELAKGSAHYTVEVWYAPPSGQADETAKAHLNFIGDTGPELLMMRRSFPFQADLARIGDAQCTLEKATS